MNYILYFLVILIVLLVGFPVYKNRGIIKNYLFPGKQGRDVLLSKKVVYRSPIQKLSFEESLNVDIFINELRDFSLNYTDEIFREIYGIKGESAKSGRLVEDVKADGANEKITWKLSEEGKKILKKKSVEWFKQKETGSLLPRIFNNKDGLLKKIFKGAGPEKITQLTKLANIAVNAAHIISGADHARELNVIDKKVDYLLAARKIDRLSKLESNFYLAKELIIFSSDPVNRSKVLDLHREVVELRTNWRNEIEQKLRHIEDPHAKSFFDKLFTTQKSRDREVYGEISKFEEDIALIDFSFIYDIALCESIGHINSSLGVEINRLEKTKNLLQKKAGYLSGASDVNKINRQIYQLDRILTRYRKFLPI